MYFNVQNESLEPLTDYDLADGDHKREKTIYPIPGNSWPYKTFFYYDAPMNKKIKILFLPTLRALEILVQRPPMAERVYVLV